MTDTVYYDVEKIKQDLALIPQKALEAADDEIRQACDNMVGYAKINVRVDTGSLRDSIRVERGGEGEHWRRWRVRAGGYIVNPKTNRLVNYAAIVEEKYPYLRPAFDMIKVDLVELVRRRVVEALEK